MILVFWVRANFPVENEISPCQGYSYVSLVPVHYSINIVKFLKNNLLGYIEVFMYCLPVPFPFANLHFLFELHDNQIYLSQAASFSELWSSFNSLIRLIQSNWFTSWRRTFWNILPSVSRTFFLLRMLSLLGGPNMRRILAFVCQISWICANTVNQIKLKINSVKWANSSACLRRRQNQP